MVTQLKDCWGNDAIDFGELADLKEKYADNLIVTTTEKPFGPCHVLHIFGEFESERANEWAQALRDSMRARGLHPNGGVIWGTNVSKRKMQGYQGGAGY